MIHPNSLESFKELEDQLEPREQEVLDIYIRTNGVLTDRQVRKKLSRLQQRGMNYVRPRITSLIGKRLLIEAGTTKCKTTGRPVRQCKWDPAHDFAAPLDHPPAAD